ncbi:hypothetical protein SUGI_0765200, partial [Cryptomeria japonica]
HEMQGLPRVHITDEEMGSFFIGWEVSYDLLPRSKVAALEGKHIFITANPVFEFSVFSGNELIFTCITNPFGFSIKHRSYGEVLFNSSYGSLVFII